VQENFNIKAIYKKTNLKKMPYRFVFFAALLLLLSPELALLGFVDVALIEVFVILLGVQLQLYGSFVWLTILSIKERIKKLISSITESITQR
jgi:hypothetical protein